MPTGYTADVADGKVSDFRTFALRCARNFGATIMQRDEPMNSPPRPREVSPFYAKDVQAAQARVAQLAQMTIDEATAERDREHDARVRSNEEIRRRRLDTLNRYNGMLARAVEWKPPPRHERLKSFMIEQLQESIKFDCADYELGSVRLVPNVWLETERANAARRLERAVKALHEEEQRCADATSWIEELYAALPEEGK